MLYTRDNVDFQGLPGMRASSRKICTFRFKPLINSIPRHGHPAFAAEFTFLDGNFMLESIAHMQFQRRMAEPRSLLPQPPPFRPPPTPTTASSLRDVAIHNMLNDVHSNSDFIGYPNTLPVSLRSSLLPCWPLLFPCDALALLERAPYSALPSLPSMMHSQSSRIHGTVMENMYPVSPWISPLSSFSFSIPTDAASSYTYLYHHGYCSLGGQIDVDYSILLPPIDETKLSLDSPPIVPTTFKTISDDTYTGSEANSVLKQKNARQRSTLRPQTI